MHKQTNIEANGLPLSLNELFATEQPLRESNTLSSVKDSTLHRAKHSKSIPKKQSNLLGKITEIITSDQQDSSLAMLLPLLATLSKDDRWFAWVSPPKNLPKSLLQEAGIALDKIMLLYPDEQNTALNLAKKALSAGTCHAVISWNGELSEHELGNLEQSAMLGASHGIVIRRRSKP